MDLGEFSKLKPKEKEFLEKLSDRELEYREKKTNNLSKVLLGVGFGCWLTFMGVFGYLSNTNKINNPLRGIGMGISLGSLYAMQSACSKLDKRYKKYKFYRENKEHIQNLQQ